MFSARQLHPGAKGVEPREEGGGAGSSPGVQEDGSSRPRGGAGQQDEAKASDLGGEEEQKCAQWPMGTVRKVGMAEGTLKTSVPTSQPGLAPALRGEQVKCAAGCAWCLWTPVKSWDYL